MAKYIIAALAAFLLSACTATTPTQQSEPTPKSAGQTIHSWFCYENDYVAEYEPRNWVFYAQSGTDRAVVTLYGEDIPATFKMHGLDAHFYFDSYALIIPPAGRTEYRVSDRLEAMYSCVKNEGSR